MKEAQRRAPEVSVNRAVVPFAVDTNPYNTLRVFTKAAGTRYGLAFEAAGQNGRTDEMLTASSPEAARQVQALKEVLWSTQGWRFVGSIYAGRTDAFRDAHNGNPSGIFRGIPQALRDQSLVESSLVDRSFVAAYEQQSLQSTVDGEPIEQAEADTQLYEDLTRGGVTSITPDELAPLLAKEIDQAIAWDPELDPDNLDSFIQAQQQQEATIANPTKKKNEPRWGRRLKRVALGAVGMAALFSLSIREAAPAAPHTAPPTAVTKQHELPAGTVYSRQPQADVDITITQTIKSGDMYLLYGAQEQQQVDPTANDEQRYNETRFFAEIDQVLNPDTPATRLIPGQPVVLLDLTAARDALDAKTQNADLSAQQAIGIAQNKANIRQRIGKRLNGCRR